MTMSHGPYFTDGGLPGIDQVPFGMHVRHFYSDRDQLVAALVPYVMAGLRANERCLWVTAPPLPAFQALEALRGAWSGADEAIEAGALRILDFDQWYASSAGLNGLEVVQLWLQEEERAIAEGYNGLRITGNTGFLTPDDWPTFMEYEQAVTARFRDRRIVSLCSYSLAQCNDEQMREVLHSHHCALEGPDGHGQVLVVPHLPGGLESKS
jgi:hypothetical protein